MAILKNPKKMLRIALEFVTMLNRKGIFEETRVYAGGKCLSDREITTRRCEKLQDGDGNPYYVCEWPPDDIPVEYKNRDTITVTTEGILYDIMNYDLSAETMKAINDFAEKHGFYIEQGYPWAFTFEEL